MQNQAPDPARQLDDSMIMEEFAKVPAHGTRGRCFRCAEVDYQHAGLVFGLVTQPSSVSHEFSSLLRGDWRIRSCG